MTAVRPVLARHFVVALVLALSASLLAAQPAAAIDNRSSSQIRQRMEYFINRERVSHGMRQLRNNAKMQRGAAEHARRMAYRGTIFHDSNLGSEVPRDCMAWAENVARTSASDAARSAMTMFMNSSSHRANVLSSRMTVMGVGVYKRGNYTYLVQRFCDR